MKSKLFLTLALGIFLVVLAGSVSAIVTYGDWIDGTQETKIIDGESASFNVDFFSMNPPMTINVNVFDMDANLIHSFFSGPLIVNSNSYSNTLTITENIYQNPGMYEIVLSGTDDISSKDSHSLILDVRPLGTNSPPVINSNPVTNVDELQPYSYQIQATDPEGDTLAYNLTQAPNWLSIDSSTGLVSGTAPSVDSDTDYPITIQVSDGSNTVSQIYTLTVRNIPAPGNNVPVITSTPIKSVNENAQYVYDVEASDADNDILTYSLTTAPNWLTIDSATGLVSGTAPVVSAETNFNVVVSVSDSLDAATQSYTLTVLNIPTANNAPVIDSTPVTSVDEDDSYSYQVTATDVDGDSLSYSITGPNWLTIDSSTGLISGTSPEVASDTDFNVVVSVSDGTDSASQSYTLTVLDTDTTKRGRASAGGGGLNTLGGTEFEEQQYLNQFKPITAAEEEAVSPQAKSNFLRVLLVIFWLIVFLFLVVLAVMLARRIGK